MKEKHIEFALGVVVGAALFGGSVAYASGILAERSYQTFFVNDQQVELEAYAIGGHNYVQLRDVGRAANFNVCYDPSRNAAVIQPGKPYTGEDMVAPVSTPSESVDHAAQANPAIFEGDLSRENYNAIRDTVLHRDEIAAGDYQPIPMGAFTRYGVVDEVTAAIGGYPVYEPISQPDGSYICTAKCPESYKDAVAHTQGFINSLEGMSDRDKVTAIEHRLFTLLRTGLLGAVLLGPSLRYIFSYQKDGYKIGRQYSAICLSNPSDSTSNKVCLFALNDTTKPVPQYITEAIRKEENRIAEAIHKMVGGEE